MRGLSDTSPEAQRVFDQVHRALPAWRKWEILDDLHHFGRELHAAGVLSREPGATPDRIRDDWVARHYGRFPSLGGQSVSASGEIRATLDRVTAVLDMLGINYALGGSLASSIHGISRNTIDADVCVEPFAGKETAFAESFGPEFVLSRDAIVDAIRRRTGFNIIETTAGFKVDVFIRKDRPFDVSMMARRRPIQAPGEEFRPVYVMSAEDVVLLKLEWYRLGNEISDRQWSDVLGVLRTQAGRLDEKYIDRWAADLGVADLWERIRAEAAPPENLLPLS